MSGRVEDREGEEIHPVSRIAYLEKLVWRQNGGESTPLVTRTDRLEGRVTSVEKNQTITMRLAWAILVLLLGTLGETIRADATRSTTIVQPQMHSYIQ